MQFKDLLEKTNNRVNEDRDEKDAAAAAIQSETLPGSGSVRDESPFAPAAAQPHPAPVTLQPLLLLLFSHAAVPRLQAAEQLEHAVDGLDSDEESGVAASAGLAARKRKGKPLMDVHIPSRPGMKTSPSGVHIKQEMQHGSSGSSASGGASAMPSGGAPSLGDMTGGGLDSPWRLLNDKGALTSMPSFGGGTPMNLASLMPQAQQSPGGILPDISGDMGNLSDTPALGSLQGISGWSNSPGAD